MSNSQLKVLHFDLESSITMSATLPAMAADGDDFTYDGINYTVISEADKTCKTKDGFISAGNEVAGHVVIPETVLNGNESYTVVGLGDKAFSYCHELTSIELPNTITAIGEQAFYFCEGLSKIVIPNSVISIGNEAFYCCEGLSKIVIPNSVISIGSRAFYNCRGLREVIIPKSVTSVGSEAFDGCGLAKTAYPNTISNPFTNGRNVSYPAEGTIVEDGIIYNVEKTIIYYASYGISGSFTIPNSVTSIGVDAFSYCKSLTSVNIPNSVTSIGEYAFSSCYGLTSVDIPNLVTSIGGSAFSNCSSLKEVVIPNSVTSIGVSAFSNCI